MGKKTCSLFCHIAAERDEKRFCAFYQPRIKPVLKKVRSLLVAKSSEWICSNLICCKTGLDMGGKTCNKAIQLVLRQCCKTSCTFLLPVLPQLKEMVQPERNEGWDPGSHPELSTVAQQINIILDFDFCAHTSEHRQHEQKCRNQRLNPPHA